MNIQYSHLVPIALVALMAGACSDQNDLPTPVVDPIKYITFAPPSLNLNATMDNFSTSGERTGSRAMANGVGEFKVWGFCVGRTFNKKDPATATAILEWNDKSQFFTSADNTVPTADLVALNGSIVDINGKYASNFSSWNENDNALHSFIGATTDKNSDLHASQNDNSVTKFTMLPAGSSIVADKNTTPETTKTFNGPCLMIELPTISSQSISYDVQPDVMVAATFDKRSGSGFVPMSFMHLMTGIRFKFHNHAKKDLTIKSVTYGGTFFKKAYLDFTTDSPELSVSTLDEDKYKCTFTLLDSNHTQIVKDGSSDFMNVDGTTVTLLLLPNPAGTIKDDGEYVLGSEKRITITYRLNGDTEDRVYVMDDEASVKEHFVLNYIPKPNTLHTANFHFVGDEFYVVFQDDETKNWQNGTNGDRVDITIK